ncbi:hypothetical protein SRHO_G00005870 [Serrasalmus rhombeus]
MHPCCSGFTRHRALDIQVFGEHSPKYKASFGGLQQPKMSLNGKACAACVQNKTTSQLLAALLEPLHLSTDFITDLPAAFRRFCYSFCSPDSYRSSPNPEERGGIEERNRRNGENEQKLDKWDS